MITRDDLTRAAGPIPAAQAGRIDACLAATNAYVARYRGHDGWTDDVKLGAALLCKGLLREGYTPAVGEGYEQQASVWARVTDVRIEQLLRIGRYAPPVVG